MNEQKFTQLLGGIDPALIARAEQSVPMRKKPSFRHALIAAMAAVLALLLCSAPIIVAFIPTTLDITYPTQGETAPNRNAWIYYTNESGKQRREYVRLPDNEQNVFAAWAHLNGLGEEYVLHGVEYADVATWAGPYTDVVCSTALRDDPNSEALIAALQKTFARYLGVPANQVSVRFADHPVTLEFSHDLTETPIRLKSGDTFTVTVTMTNISGEDIVYEGSQSDFIPKAKLLAKSAIYVAHEIFPKPHESTDEFAQYRLAPGESKSFTYTFRIPYATSSVIITGHDLTVYFGEQSKTFEKVTTVVYAFAASEAKSAFEDFVLTHTSEDNAELQSIWDSYTYQGESIMEQMQKSASDGNIDGNPFKLESGRVAQGEQTLFAYTKETKQFKYGWIEFYNHAFTGTALPDGMTLPLGITEQDSVLDALIKMGIDEQTAAEYLAQEGTVTLAGASFSDVTSSVIPDYRGTIDLVCNPLNYVIVCTVEKGIIPASHPYPQATRSVSLIYDRDNQRFSSININVNLPTRPNVTFDALPTFTEVAGKECSITLTQEQADALHKAMTQGKWQSYEANAEYDCQGTIGEIPFKYSSVTGQLTVGGFTVQLYGGDMIELNKYLGIDTYFTME